MCDKRNKKYIRLDCNYFKRRNVLFLQSFEIRSSDPRIFVIFMTVALNFMAHLRLIVTIWFTLFQHFEKFKVVSQNFSKNVQNKV